MYFLQVHVRIRGQLAACSGNNDLYVDVPRSSHKDYCGFKYGHMATPTVTGVDPDHASSDAAITISGTGFSEALSENYVLFGEVECTVLSSTTTSIECRLGSGFAGFKGLYLHVLHAGVAEANALGLTYNLVLNEISPSQGSQTGGTEVTITGSGFYQDTDRREPPSYASDMSTDCVSGWRNEVSIGGRPCTVIQFEGTSLTVKTPAQIAGGAVSTYDLEVSVVCPDNASISITALLTDIFTYNSAFTPSVFNIMPSAGAIQGGQTVTISGEGFSLNTIDNEILVSRILISMHVLSTIPPLQFGAAACTVTVSTGTLLTCTTPPHDQGQVEVSVVVAGKGKASGEPLFTYNLQLSSVSHCSG